MWYWKTVNVVLQIKYQWFIWYDGLKEVLNWITWMNEIQILKLNESNFVMPIIDCKWLNRMKWSYVELNNLDDWTWLNWNLMIQLRKCHRTFLHHTLNFFGLIYAKICCFRTFHVQTLQTSRFKLLTFYLTG